MWKRTGVNIVFRIYDIFCNANEPHQNYCITCNIALLQIQGSHLFFFTWRVPFIICKGRTFSFTVTNSSAKPVKEEQTHTSTSGVPVATKKDKLPLMLRDIRGGGWYEWTWIWIYGDYLLMRQVIGMTWWDIFITIIVVVLPVIYNDRKLHWKSSYNVID